MSELTIQLSDVLRQRVERLAAQDGISVDQLIARAAAERGSAVFMAGYLVNRGKISRKDFEDALKSVRNNPPLPGDEIK